MTTSAQDSPAPVEAKSRMREVKASFLGYQAAGKSTFLTAAVLASSLGRLRSRTSGRALTITEQLLQGEPSFFASDTSGKSRTELLRLKRQVPKTTEKWERINLRFEFAGERPFNCNTVDYTGELAAVNKEMDLDRVRLQEEIQISDCLFVFFDASLQGSAGPAGSPLQRLQGQGEAIQRAYQVFTEFRPGWPIVIVVTKADLLFAGTPDNVSAEIKRLNGRSAESIEEGKRVFRDMLHRQGASTIADVLLESRQQTCVRVCFVAALGALPEQRSENGESAYTIANLEQWMPLGIAETLESGLDEAIRKQKTTERKAAVLGAIRRNASLAAIILIVVALLFGVWSRDRSAVAALQQQVANYDRQAGIQTSTVLQQSRSVLHFTHPFVFLAGRSMLIGSFPDIANADQARAIERRFTLQDLTDRQTALLAFAQNLSEGTKNQSEVQLRSQEGYEQMMDRMATRNLEWETLGNDIRAARLRFEQLPGGADDIKQLAQQYGPARAEFLVQVIGAAWQVAKAQKIAAKPAEEKALTYFDQLQELQLAGEVDKAQLDRGREANDRGRCDLRFDQHADTSDPKAQFESLVQTCRECAGQTLRLELCPMLASGAARWDFEEATGLYSAFSLLQQPQDVTPELVAAAQTYLEHTQQRRSLVPHSKAAFGDRAKQLLDWRHSLAGSYRLAEIELTIQEAEPFVKFDKQYYECATGISVSGCSETGANCESEYGEPICADPPVASAPAGTLSVVVGGVNAISTPYEGFSARLQVGSVEWEPGQAIEVVITNESNGQSTTLADTSTYSLLNVAEAGLTNAHASARLPRVAMPKLPFDPRTLGPPKQPAAGR